MYTTKAIHFLKHLCVVSLSMLRMTGVGGDQPEGDAKGGYGGVRNRKVTDAEQNGGDAVLWYGVVWFWFTLGLGWEKREEGRVVIIKCFLKNTIPLLN